MAATEKAIKIAPKSDPEIKAKISRKLNKKSKATSTSNTIGTLLISIMGVFAVVPAVLFGVFTFFGSGFKCGIEATGKMYNELMEDAKGWAK